MVRNREKRNRYDRAYPTYIKPENLVWVLEKGDCLTDGKEYYSVTQIIRSPVPGELPKLILKAIEQDAEINSTGL